MSYGRLKHRIFIGVIPLPVVTDPPTPASTWLLENGDTLLLENSDTAILENE